MNNALIILIIYDDRLYILCKITFLNCLNSDGVISVDRYVFPSTIKAFVIYNQ